MNYVHFEVDEHGGLIRKDAQPVPAPAAPVAQPSGVFTGLTSRIRDWLRGAQGPQQARAVELTNMHGAEVASADSPSTSVV